MQEGREGCRKVGRDVGKELPKDKENKKGRYMYIHVRTEEKTRQDAKAKKQVKPNNPLLVNR